MRKAKTLFPVLLLLLSVLLCSCAKRTDVGKDDSYIYSLNKKNADMLKASFWAFTAIVFLIIVIVVVAANVAASKKSKKQINKE